ncbi:Deoxyribodipyrimidine photolyase [Lysobacter dokdonensis DS-58]|uniref:Deoxyribodipyrimidine photolyase n=1 Tax=Lysobacter dokdonensis DS-58 TaxID=1300345 RepID=A0A0A2WPV7_9GAMM|nr:deoxyribodipyrimidine photo-lyase [Lysobacter dokdonensis]KGQ20787.1 Deoxyribodipyrimidine photolyase [Lysobacter dokdonensis DS-58]
MPSALVWFRDDLRLDDQPALQAALAQGYAPVPVYVHAPEEEGEWAPGAASDAWRRRSLTALDAGLRARGSKLVCVRGPTFESLEALAQRTQAEAVFWTRRYEPLVEKRDADIKRRLRRSGLHAESHNGALLIEPWEVETKAGDPYKVFTPYFKSAIARMRTPRVFDAPARLPPVAFDGEAIDGVLPAPTPAWDRPFWSHWMPGEAGARTALQTFVSRVEAYPEARDLPAVDGTSSLSPHLHFGEVSVQRVYATIAQCGAPKEARIAYLRQLFWREFAHHLLHHFPRTTNDNLDPRFDDFDWAPVDATQFDAWKTGNTGIPIVDAGMRQLWRTGWMHNRVRMLVASFLTKHMRNHWLHGARWFRETLVDYDLANNTLGWQWVAGTGADAAPYFRIFNPQLQARRFDPEGAYVKRWIPELGTSSYPSTPVVDLAQGRADALAAYARRR